MDGILHVIEQLGQAHKQALAVVAEQGEMIQQQALRIQELEAEAQNRSET